MNAQEMFESMGFKKYLNEFDELYKEEYGYEVTFRYKRKAIEIKFNGFNHGYVALLVTDHGSSPILISKKLHKAINQQCKELGWLDEQ